ncbi:MAG TPA: response regulator [Gemmataceae bacterium]
MVESKLEPRSYAILITDDDAGSREVLREIVEPEGFRAVLASSGEEALEIVRGERIDLAVFDMHMPRLTGLETLELARQVRGELPAILVTADPTDELIRRAFFAHFYSVIPKPVSRNVLLYTVLRALGQVYGVQTGPGPEAPAKEPD